MAKYSDIVAGLTVGDYGQAGPAGWTSRFAASGGSFAVSADASAPSGKAINIRKTATGRVFWSVDAVNADPDRSASTIIALVRINNIHSSGSSASFGGIAARGAGSAGSENLVTTMFGRNANLGRFRTVHYVNGTGTILESSGNDWVQNGIYWLKQTILDGNYTSTLYLQSDLNGTPVKTVSGPIPANETNWHGIFAFDATASIDILYLAIGTGTDQPDPPSAANPVLSAATGTETGSSTADLSVTTDTSGTPINLSVTTSATPPLSADIISGAGAVYATSQAVTAVGAQPFSATGLAAAQAYYGHFVQGENSNIITTNAFTTDAAPVVAPETAPGNLNPVSISDTEITATWDLVANASGYDLEIDGIATDVGNVSTVTNAGLTASTQYSFRVRAYNAAGDGPWSAAVLETTQAASTAITLITDIDSGNISATLSSIIDPTSLTPRINLLPRPETTTGTNGSGWRRMGFAIENAGGKSPTFALDRTNRADDTQNPLTTWLPQYTQDGPEVLNPTYVYATSRTLVGGTGGTVEFSFDAPLPAGRIYVSTHPMGAQAQAATLATDLLNNYPGIVTPTLSANAQGVYFTSPSELDENGRQVGQHDTYAFKAQFGGATNDGGPKRKLLLTAGIHAAGENTSWVCFLSCLKYILDSPNADAVALRANWDLYIYFNLTPNGIFGGHRRHNLRSLTDPNRDLVNKSLVEIAAFTAAVEADTNSAVDVCFDWHCFASAIEDFISWGPDTPVARRFIEVGAPIFGSPARGGGLWIETSGVLSVYAKNVLGAKYSAAAEIQQRGNTSYSNYQLVGQNWAKTLAATDADGMFYTPPANEYTAGSETSFIIESLGGALLSSNAGSQVGFVPVANGVSSLLAGAGSSTSISFDSGGGSLLSVLAGGDTDFAVTSSGGAEVQSAPEPGAYEAGGQSQFSVVTLGGSSAIVNAGGGAQFTISAIGGATTGGDGVIIGVITMPVSAIQYRVTA